MKGNVDLVRLQNVIGKIDDDILFRSESPLSVSSMTTVERIYDIAIATLFKTGNINSVLSMIQAKDHILAQNDINYFKIDNSANIEETVENIRKLYSEKISLRLQGKPYSQVENKISNEKEKYSDLIKNTIYEKNI